MLLNSSFFVAIDNKVQTKFSEEELGNWLQGLWDSKTSMA
jgi:hypothetical protein